MPGKDLTLTLCYLKTLKTDQDDDFFDDAENCPAPFGATYLKNRWKSTGKAAATLNLTFRKPVKPQPTKNRLVTFCEVSCFSDRNSGQNS